MHATTIIKTAKTLLILGRVSNLPTVIGNALIGLWLANHSANPISAAHLTTVLIAAVLFYISGMFLNDAYDADHDRQHQAQRPIPSGQITQTQVFTIGYSLMLGALLISAWLGLASLIVGLALAAAIIGYDRHHKTNAYSPWLMALSRALLILFAASSLYRPEQAIAHPGLLALAMSASYLYTASLTAIAKRHNQNRLHQSPNNPAFLVLWLGLSSLFILLSSPWWLITLWLAYGSFIYARLSGHHQSWLPAPLRNIHPIAALIAGLTLIDANLISVITPSLPQLLTLIGLTALTLTLQKLVPGT